MNTAIRDFDDWQNMLTAVCGYFTFQPMQNKPFSGLINLGRFGSLDIAEISGTIKQLKKTERDVGQSDEANLFLILGLEGEAVLEQCGQSSRLGVGDICLIDSRRPSEFRYKNGFKQISVHLPEMQTREIFRNRKIPLAQTIHHKDNDMLRASILNMYGHARVGAEADYSAQSKTEELKQNDECFKLLWQSIFSDDPVMDTDILDVQQCRRVNMFIEENLHDADLDLDRIASGCGISKRSLYRLFEQHGLSPFNWIRMRRLEIARNELMVATGAGKCTDVAFKYGFNSSAHFSRVFKNKFGLSPRQFQNHFKFDS